MKRSHILGALGAVSLWPLLVELSQAQVVGSLAAEVTVVRVEQAVVGLSTRKQVLDRAVYNDRGQRIGKVEDLILDPEGTASLVIIGAGAFVGTKRHSIALPVELLTERDGVLTVSGATKDVVKGLPTFSYAKAPARPSRKLRASPDEAGASVQASQD